MTTLPDPEDTAQRRGGLVRARLTGERIRSVGERARESGEQFRTVRERAHEAGDRARVAGSRAVARTSHRADQVGLTARRGARALLSPRGLRGMATEVAWLTTHTVFYPLGLAEEKAHDESQRLTLQGLPPRQRGLLIGDVEAAGTPIILVHGVIDNRSVFGLLRRGLRRRGFGRIVSLNYSMLTHDIREVAYRLSELIEQVVRETGYERVHVVGHSMGGLVGRYYVQNMNGDRRVHTLVTLGSPHLGTTPARWVPVPISRQMSPGSDLIEDFEAPAPGCRTRFIAMWSDLDLMIVPKRNARIIHPDLNARNIFFRGIGHMSFPINGKVVHTICSTLAHLDHEGHTVAAGATSIRSSTGRRSDDRPGAGARYPSAADFTASQPARTEAADA